GCAIAQKYDDSPPLRLETLQRCMHRVDTPEYVAHDIGTMEARGHVLAVADATIHERHVLDRIEQRHVGITLQRSDLAFYWKFADALDELVAHLPVGDEICNRDALQAMLLGKGLDRIATHHCPVVVHQFGKYADGRQATQLAEIDAGFRMPRAHQHAAV